MFTTFGKDVRLNDLIEALQFIQSEIHSAGGTDPYLVQYSLDFADLDGDGTIEECVRLTFASESEPGKPESREYAE